MQPRQRFNTGRTLCVLRWPHLSKNFGIAHYHRMAKLTCDKVSGLLQYARPIPYDSRTLINYRSSGNIGRGRYQHSEERCA